MKTLNQYEQETLKELREVKYQGFPLINFVIKCIEEREMNDQKVGDVLYKLHCDNKIQITPNTIQQNYFKLIIAHYELLHNERNVKSVKDNMQKLQISQAQLCEDLGFNKGDLSNYLSLNKPLPISRLVDLNTYFEKKETKAP